MSGTDVAKREDEVLLEPSEEVGGLMRLALEQKMPVEVLERLVALQERVSDREARAEFFDALSRFQDEVPQIHKSATAEIATRGGSKYSYAYAPLENIARAIRGPLRDHGLSYTWTTEGGGDGILNVVCVLRHVGGHEERSTFPVPTDTSAAMSGAQKQGAALTYGKRQSLTSALGLTTADDDVDGADTDSSQYITEEQVADLAAKIEEVGADEARFLKWLGVAHLEAVTTKQLPEALAALKQKGENS